MKQFNQLSPQAQTTIIQTLLSLYSGDLPQHVKDEIAEWKIYSTSKQPQQVTSEPTKQELVYALSSILDRYISVAASGDAGNWDYEAEAEVVEARRVLEGITNASTH